MCAPIMRSLCEYLYELYIREDLGVSLKGCGLILDTAQNSQEVLSMIASCNSLKYLELEGNTIGVEAAEEIGKHLENRRELEIALWKDIFTGCLKHEIPRAIDFLLFGVGRAGARLQRLDLSDNAIGTDGVQSLVSFFMSPSSFSLKELILNNNGLGPDGGSMLADALTKCFILSRDKGVETFYLKVFVCGRNRLENMAALRFATFFSTIKSLEEVHMPHNGIRRKGIQILAKSLSFNSNLRLLNINDNTVGLTGAASLAEVLPSFANLEEVNFGDCLLTCQGALTITKALSGTRSAITIVNLESNEIDADTGFAIANYLKSCTNLLQVYLSGNEFGKKDGESITALLAKANGRIDVDMDGQHGEEEDTNVCENDETESENEIQGVQDSLHLYSPIATDSEEEYKHDPFDISVERKLYFDNTDYDLECFLAKPSMDLFNRLTQLPISSDHFIHYFKTNEDVEKLPFLCVSTAIHLSNMLLSDSLAQTCFNGLLMNVIQSHGANTFATILLTHFGFIRPEDNHGSTTYIRPTQHTIQALKIFVDFNPIPVIVLLCLREFFKSTTPVKRNEWLTVTSFDLENVVEKKLSIIPPNINIYAVNEGTY